MRDESPIRSWYQVFTESVHVTSVCFFPTLILGAWFTYLSKPPEDFPVILVASGPALGAVITFIVASFMPTLLPAQENRRVALFSFPLVYLTVTYAVHVIFTGEKAGILSRFSFLPGDAWRDPWKWVAAYALCVVCLTWATRQTRSSDDQKRDHSPG
ncbi:hypothetical protein QPK87_10645 [Kamptonema cortianum]|nr:hypothetical protein [Kamptonema cortianum]